MPRMKKTSFFNFFPTKAEEESSSSNGGAGYSSEVEIRTMGPQTRTVNYMNKWKFTKELTASDLDHRSKLSLPQGAMLNNILCHLSRGGANVLEGYEENVRIKDVETNTYHEMIIFRDSRNSFFMKGHWKSEFIRRRNLQVGHVIGFCWSDAENCLEFKMRTLAKKRENPPDGLMCPGGWMVFVDYNDSLVVQENGRVDDAVPV